jgi:hypothetical protein
MECGGLTPLSLGSSDRFILAAVISEGATVKCRVRPILSVFREGWELRLVCEPSRIPATR